MSVEDRFKVGSVGVWEKVITHEYTAEALGNPGVDVAGTPWLAAFAEKASLEGIQDYLAPDESTVGVHLELFHLAPTPTGMKVTVRSELVRVEGRKLFFKFEAHDDVEKVAEGSHDRVVVNLQKILEKARAKRQRS